jgi:FMN phosphatase YigB (HAD superfamily)
MVTVKKSIRRILDNKSSGDTEQLAKRVNSFKYVSFDIFDTLVKRDVPEPTDVFEIVGERINVPDFKQKRVNAEKRAREKSSYSEVSLNEIYDQFTELSQQLRAQAITEEINVEIGVSVPNLELIDLYNQLVKNAYVVLISDMYLDTDTIEKIMNHCGITGYKKLYVSNEIGMTKRSGDLFRHVLKDIGILPGDLVHIGNSYFGDYRLARKCSISSFKVRTESIRTARKHKDVLCYDEKKKRYLNSFINNHIPNNTEYYFRFGYENLGPLMYGFVSWLFSEVKKEKVEQVFFLSRDGYPMLKVYKKLGYDKSVPAYYFEASRRSLRVPAFSRNMTYEAILKEISLPSKTCIAQIIDGWGLDAGKYTGLLNNLGMNPNDNLDRESLKENTSIKNLYELLHDDIMTNAEEEKRMLVGYLNQFDFSKKTAIVDIGWRGSMQRYINQVLVEQGKNPNGIHGYYIGLRADARWVLGDEQLKAKGYAFDQFNNVNDQSLERFFLGLLEIPFLEQNGSVKRYVKSGSSFISERYPYEYEGADGSLTKEALRVKQIQEGALGFVSDYMCSIVGDYVGNDSSIMFSNYFEIGTSPCLYDVKAFGDMDFFDNGINFKMAKPSSLFKYVIKPGKLKKDLYDARWKIGFLKGLIKLPISYQKLFETLVKKK